MKTLPVILILVFAIACNKPSDQTVSSPDSTATAATPTAEPVNVVIWGEVGVRETPSDKGKYLTSVYLGEHVQVPGDTASEVSGKKRNHFRKVTLSDGKSGWVRDEFIATDVHPAAVTANAQMYKRPDLATVTEKVFMIGDFVVVRKTENDFVEVTGKLMGDKWFTTGFIRSSIISYKEIDVEYAALKRRAEEETKEKIKSALQSQLADQSVFGESDLWKYDYTTEEEEDDAPAEATSDNPYFELDPPTEGLVGFYRLDGGNADDASGNQKNGQSISTTGGTDKNEADGGTYFQRGAYVTIPDDPSSFTGQFSVVACFKTSDINLRDQCVVSKGRSTDGTGFNFGYNNIDGRRILYLGMIGTKPVGVEVTTNLSGDQWVYLAGTFDMRVAKLYLNGQLVGTAAIPSTETAEIAYNLGNSSQPIEIGRELATLDRYFFGTIDNVGVWNRALSAEEIVSMNK